ncbi:hypothetical protein Pfo_024668 [Paulownia fortunei]|nr:hypothetical protein Pfo_024668 [Paulownia fortunei]
MVMMKNGGGVTLSIVVLSAVFATSIAVVFVLGYFSDRTNGVGSFYSGSEAELKIPIVELVTTAAHTRNDESRAVLSSEFSSKFKPTVSRKANNKLEQGLARARAAIRKAASTRNLSVIIKNNDILSSAIYRNPSAFFQSFKEMERRFKVYVYQEGELPIVHDGPCKDIYTSEGRFIHEMEHGNNRFRTNNAQVAHVYFMPFSVTWMVKYIYRPNTYNVTPLKVFVSDYVKLISTKHPFWNRTQGADHFMLSCHDWGPHASQGNAFLYNTSIRVLCNANSSEGFNPQKDVSLPEIHLYGGNVNPKLISPPPTNMSRPYLAFFAGGIHAPLGQFSSNIGRAETLISMFMNTSLKIKIIMTLCYCPSFAYAPVDMKWLAPELLRLFMLNASL